MIDVKTKLRKSYYILINGQLTLNAVPVPVFDTVAGTGAGTGTYVLLNSGPGRMVNTHQSLGTEELMRVDIVSTGTFVSNADLDTIAGQILALVMPTPQTHGLPSQTGICIQNVRVTNDYYNPLRTDGAVNVGRRMITFTQTVTPTV